MKYAKAQNLGLFRRCILSALSLALIGCTTDPPSGLNQNPQVAALQAPNITSFSGNKKDGFWDEAIAPKYPKSWYVERYAELAEQVYPFVVTGSAFGHKTGQLRINALGYNVLKITDWSNTRIAFVATTDHSVAVPAPNASVTVVTADGVTSAAFPLRLIPSIHTRVYGQCTWWAAKRSIETSGEHREPGGRDGSAYSPEGTFAPSPRYVPRPYDVWIVHRGDCNTQLCHQAFVESVDSLFTNGSNGTRGVTYDVRLSQFNTNPADIPNRTIELDESIRDPHEVVHITVAEEYNTASPLKKAISPRRFVHADQAFKPNPDSPTANRIWRAGGEYNSRPSATIRQPVNGARFSVGQSISFQGIGVDTEDGDISGALQWSSNIDGQFATGPSPATPLSAGKHRITLSLRDAPGANDLDFIEIEVVSACVASSTSSDRTAILAADCPPPAPPPPSPPPPTTVAISVNPTSATIDVGATTTIAATVTGTDNTGVWWSSSSPDVGTVSDAGVVQGIAPGSVEITARSKADAGKTATATVTVKAAAAPPPAPPPPTSISITVSPTSATLEVGRARQLSATVSGTSNSAVRWVSADPSRATVNSSGLVTGVAVGAVDITVSADADPTKVATAKVTVTAPPQSPQGPTAVTLAATNVIKHSFRMNGTVNPNGSSTAAYFESAVSSDMKTGYVSSTALGIGAGISALPLSADRTSLACGVTFYFRMVGVNAAGVAHYGSVLSVTTAPC